jgi:hypothetical protein
MGLCDGKMWVLTKAWLKMASEVWFSNDYEPRWRWENGLPYWSDPRFGQYRGSFVPPDFLSPRYLEGEPQEKAMWRQFFLTAGVKDETKKELLKRFAEAFFLHYHGYFPDAKVEWNPQGCDFRVVSNGGTRYYEIKGQAEDQDVELTSNEGDLASEKKEAYILVVVPGVPNAPALYEVPDPVNNGQTRVEVKVPKAVWGRFRIA